MKKLMLSNFFLILAGAVFAAKGYAVTQKFVNQSQSNIVVTWYVTDNDCKMKMVFGDSAVQSTTYFIPDTKRNVILTYNDSPVPAGVQKTYFVIPVEGIQQGPDMKVSRLSVSRTGATKTIGGLVCEQVIVRTNQNVTELWVTKDFQPPFYKYAVFFRDNLALAGLNEESIKGFPMEATTKDLGGKVINAYRFIAAEQKDFGDTDFTVPAEYQSPESLKNKGQH